MKILRKLKELTSRLSKKEKIDNSFVFPYSSNILVKRQQIWDNLQKGLLFEDSQNFINWLTPYNRVNNYKENRLESGDRTLWYLGKRTILNSYEGHFEVMKWMWSPWTNPLTKIFENIGHDFEGMEKFHYLNDYITNLLGEPTKKEIEKFGSFDLGVIQWQNGLVNITLVGIEIFNCRYSFSIGLVRDRNQEYLNNTIEKLKKQD